MDASLRRSSNNFEELNRLLNDAMQSAVGLGEDLMDSGSKYSGHVAEVESYLFELASLSHDVEIFKESIAEVKTAYHLCDDSMEPQDLSGLFTTELKRFREMSTSVYDPKTHPSSVKFRKCLEDDGNSVSDGQTQGISDGDIVVEQVQQSLNCPLTKRLLEAPVTSKVCKHSYSYSAIIEHIRKRPFPKCPVCNVPLEEVDLQKDEKLERKVRKEKRSGQVKLKSKQDRAVRL